MVDAMPAPGGDDEDEEEEEEEEIPADLADLSPEQQQLGRRFSKKYVIFEK